MYIKLSMVFQKSFGVTTKTHTVCFHLWLSVCHLITLTTPIFYAVFVFITLMLSLIILIPRLRLAPRRGGHNDCSSTSNSP